MTKFESFIESPGVMWFIILVGMAIFIASFGLISSSIDPCQKQMNMYISNYPSATPSQYLEFYKEVCDEKEK